MKTKEERQAYRRRVKIVSFCMLMFSLLVFGRLVWVQLLDGEKLRSIAEKRGRMRIKIDASRGRIFDRNGQPLTENLSDHVSLSVNRYKLFNEKRLVNDLSKVTKRPKSYFINRLSTDNSFIDLARKISPEQAGQIKDLGWSLIEKPDIRRIYPYGAVGGQVLGFLDIDNLGISGVEMVCDSILQGKPGWRVVEVDVLGNPQVRQRLPFQNAVNGGDVVLTIDISIQSVLQEELSRAKKAHQALSASGVIIDPRNGQIIAIASLDDFDPNEPNAYPVANQRCRVVSDQMELGSTFKIIPVALLLERGYADAQTLVNTDPGYIVIHGKTIHDVHHYGVLSLKKAVAKSSNVGVIKLCEPLRNDELYDFINRFGMLKRTGVELPGERVGSMPEIADWSGLTKPNIVIGQGIAVTMLSLTMAYQTIANGGIPVKPSMIYGTRFPDGSVFLNEPEYLDRVVTKQTADTITDFLTEAVENGTGGNARIEGIKIAGKTGTGSKPDLVHGGYYKDKYLSSFVGFFPVDDPRYLIMIVLDDPKKDGYYGGSVAAPAFRRTAERIIHLHPEIRQVGKGTVERVDTRVPMPDYCYQLKKDVIDQAKLDGFSLRYYGKGEVIYDQNPPAGVMVEPGSKVQLTIGPADEPAGGVVIVPMLVNQSLRDAIRKATTAGLQVHVSGSGKVVSQSLPVGRRATAGDICKIVARG